MSAVLLFRENDFVFYASRFCKAVAATSVNG